MGLRPKTARRLALIGGLLLIVVIGGVAVLTIPKLQRTRQIESFRVDGLAAHERGDHHEAHVLLGRYTRAVGEPTADPEAMLAYARSRAAFPAPRREQYAVAAKLYRAYLRREPDDEAASLELLHVLREASLWTEVIELANSLRDSKIPGIPSSASGRLSPDQRAQANAMRAEVIAEASAESLGTLRDEYYARIQLDLQDPVAVAIERRLLAEPEVAFGDIWDAYNRQLRVTKNPIPSAEIVAIYQKAAAEDLGMQVLRVLIAPRVDGSPPTLEDVANPLLEMFGYNSQTGRLEAERTIDSVRLGRALIFTFDRMGQYVAAAEFARLTAAGTDDPTIIIDHAKRRYLMGDYPVLLAIDVPEGRRADLADVVGYQAMAAAGMGDGERTNELQRELESVSFQFQAASWLAALEAHRAMASGDLVAARAALTPAIDRHTFEPVMRLMLGDVFDRMGFPVEASDSWSKASTAAEPIVWPLPYIRRVYALLDANRGLEADAVLDQVLGDTAYRQNLQMLQLRTSVSAFLARNGQLGDQETRDTIRLAVSLRQLPQATPELRGELDLALGTLYGALGLDNEARQSLSNALAEAGGTQRAIEAYAIDQRFNLGLSQATGRPPLPERIDDPELAFRAALTHASGEDATQPERIERARTMIEDGLASSGDADRVAWLVTKAAFLSEFELESGLAAWEAAIDADPQNVQTLTRSIESKTYQYDLAYIDQAISRIRELTASDGRTLSSGLRLARAQAVYGEEPDRDSRATAVGIVRSVVSAEPQNIVARRMLANMLKAKSGESIPAEKRFEKDIPGAIQQLRTLASQIEGIEAVAYLFDIAQLSMERNDDEEARRALTEIANRAADNDAVAVRFAKVMSQLGDFEVMARTLEDIFNNAQGVAKTRVGLLLAQAYDSLGDSEASVRVLGELASSGSLEASDLNRIIARLVQADRRDMAEALVDDAARFGLKEADQASVRAQYAYRFGTPEESEAALRELTLSNPQNVSAWRLLAEMLAKQGRSEDVLQVARSGLEHHPNEPDLLFYTSIAQGEPGAAVRALFGALDNEQAGLSNEQRQELERLQLALDVMETFETERQSMSPAAQIEQLSEIERRFSRIAPVVKHSLAERERLGDSSASLFRDAAAAANQHPGDPDILRLATRFAMSADQNEEAAKYAATWRGVAEDSRLEPDLYAAQAARRLDDNAKAIAVLEPYLSEAMASPDEPLNRQVLLHFGGAEIALRGEPAARARLEPLVGSSLGFRSTVWLDLAATETKTAAQATTWLQIADQAGMGEYLPRLAGVWLRLADRFEGSRADMLDRAISTAERAIVADPNDPEAYATQAIALRARSEIDNGSNWLARAEQRFLDADRLAPTDLNMLFGAATVAADDNRPGDAERHYRALLTREGVGGLFGAAIRNNLATLLTWHEPSPQRLDEALKLVEAAVAFQSHNAFLGTRGLVRYARGEYEQARQDFERVTQNDPSSFEGWAGLAATLRAMPNGDAGAAETAWSRARTMLGEEAPSPAIRNVLSRSGLKLGDD